MDYYYIEIGMVLGRTPQKFFNAISKRSDVKILSVGFMSCGRIGTIVYQANEKVICYDGQEHEDIQ